CIHCGKDGHWKRNCKVYLESLKKEKHNDASTSGIYVIEVNTNATVNNQDWVFDTDCGSHICCDMQGLKNSRRLSKEEVVVRIANGQRGSSCSYSQWCKSCSISCRNILLGFTFWIGIRT